MAPPRESRLEHTSGRALASAARRRPSPRRTFAVALREARRSNVSLSLTRGLAYSEAVIIDESPILKKQRSRLVEGEASPAASAPETSDAAEPATATAASGEPWESPRTRRRKEQEAAAAAATTTDASAAASPIDPAAIVDPSPVLQKQISRLASGGEKEWESPRKRREKERAQLQAQSGANMVETNPLLLRQMQRNASTDSVSQ